MLRWKSATILFAFLTSLGFFIVDPFGLYTDLAGVFGIGSILLASFLLSGIFLLSISKSERRISANQYTAWWLLRFNIFLVITLYLLGFLSLVALVWSSPGEGSGMFAALAVYYGAWIIPLAVVVFSLFPSIFFYKFHSNQKLLKILSIIFVVLFLGITTIYSTKVITCDSNNDWACVGRKAVNAHDVSICERVDRPSARDLCYLTMSREWDDINLCDKFSSDYLFESNQSMCLSNIAVFTNNPQVCETIKIDNIDYGKSKCLSDVQKKTSR